MRYFVCNTNKQGDWTDCEELMRAKRHAIAWYSKKRFRYTNHMKMADVGDIILFYSNGRGIIGVGKTTGVVEPLRAAHPRRFWRDRKDLHEWRIPVQRLAWDPERPFRSPFADGEFQLTFKALKRPELLAFAKSALKHFRLKRGLSAETSQSPASDVRHWTKSQGWERDPRKRKALERAAVLAAKEHFGEVGYRLIEERAKPFDLHFRKRGRDLHVEVKGTASAGEKVIITRGEKAHWDKTKAEMKLFVLPKIELDEDLNVVSIGKPIVRSLDERAEYEPRLNPTHFEYCVCSDDDE